MEKYHVKTPFAEVSDKVFRISVSCLIGIGWFVFLWGVTLPALTAGLALGVMLWLCVRQFAKRSTQKREMLMRRMIGGELALNQLLMEAPRKAAFRCALWLEPAYPLVMSQTVEWGVIGQLNGKKTLLRLIAQHPAEPVTVQQVVECARESKQRQAEHTLLCLTAPAAKEAYPFAAGLDPPMTIIDRAELIRFAGNASPATDEDLRRLSQSKQKRRSPKEWLAVVLDASRARRYFWYGTGMSVYALLTGNVFYSLPAAICLGLYAGCRLRSSEVNRRRRWTT